MVVQVIPKDKIAKIKVYYNRNAAKTMAQIQKELGCQYMINTTLFNMTTKKPAGYLTVDGIVYSQTANPYGYAVKDKKIVYSYGNNVKYPDFTGCYHVLVKDNKLNITTTESNKYGYSARSCVGLKANGDVVLFCDQTNRSLIGVANDLLNYGCTTVLNFDGGGSSQIYYNGKSLTSARKVIAYLCIWTSDINSTPSNTTNNTSQTTNTMTKKKICLDPGHGATCTNGSPDKSYYEYEFAADIANRMAKILTKHGVDVKITRTNGTDITLPERVNIANNYNPDYFVSLHSNAYGTKWNDAHGWEIYVSGFGGNAEKLAKAIETETTKIIPLTDRGIKSANYTVIKNTKAPAVLIEHGFHTNKNDVEYLKSNEWRDKYAEANCKGILQVLGINYKETQTADTDKNSGSTDDNNKDISENELAVQWAKKNNISDGTNLTANATRQQVITMLYRMSKNN